MPYAEIPGRRLHYVRRGTGEPLLLIMGMGGSHLSWGEPFLTELERDFDVIAPDNRGMGLSKDRVGEAFTTAELAGDMEAVLAALDVPSAHVLGISLGGMIAQELALAHPERVRTLALGCTYCGGPGSAPMPPETMQRLAEGWQSRDAERALRASWEANVSAGFRADDSRYDAFQAMATTYPASVEVMMLQSQAALSHDTNARLGRIEAPTLVIHGTEDEMLPYPNGELIASLIPGARLETLEGVGHMFWWEEPARSAELIREVAFTLRGT